VFALARPLLAGLTYPYDWGFIPCTKADDGDPLDILIIHDTATYPGLVLRCRPVGVLELVQTRNGREERNDRVLAHPDRSPLEGAVQDVTQLSQRALQELEKFFEVTHALDMRKNGIQGLAWGSEGGGDDQEAFSLDGCSAVFLGDAYG
jgi:inorganic pyrophosphatase